jgi:hypothetical protein
MVSVKLYDRRFALSVPSTSSCFRYKFNLLSVLERANFSPYQPLKLYLVAARCAFFDVEAAIMLLVYALKRNTAVSADSSCNS